MEMMAKYSQTAESWGLECKQSGDDLKEERCPVKREIGWPSCSSGTGQVSTRSEGKED